MAHSTTTTTATAAHIADIQQCIRTQFMGVYHQRAGELALAHAELARTGYVHGAARRVTGEMGAVLQRMQRLRGVMGVNLWYAADGDGMWKDLALEEEERLAVERGRGGA